MNENADAPRPATDAELTISPSLDLLRESVAVPAGTSLVDGRVLQLSVLAVVLGIIAAFVAQLLMGLIALVTNLAFFGQLSVDSVSPAENNLNLWVLVVPVVGGLIVGVMARFGSAAIRGHGIPEAMEQVLTNRSRIPARLTFLKPLSAAISIGTGGPFGAEGPIIATGGAIGSFFGQILTINASERKILLSAGAAAGMAATFGSPVSAVLLAIELLLFEFRPRSIIPVALASTAAAGVRAVLEGTAPVFAMPNLAQPSAGALISYVLLGAVMGVAAVAITRCVYAVEDAFDHLPIHWMWWPAIGGIAVGLVGYVAPRTLGVGYNNISDLISNRMAIHAVFVLCTLKFVSWAIALGSGTSGGTLAPLFTIGSGLGILLGSIAAHFFPGLGIDLRIAALVGMAAVFAGASRALLASVVFAFETTLQPMGLLPLLGGCSAAYLVSCLLMRHTIMTEKIARRGILAPSEYVSDILDQVLVREVASSNVVMLKADDTLSTVREWLSSGAAGTSHQGFPIVNAQGILVGVLTRRDLLAANEPVETCLRDLSTKPLKYVYDDCTVRQAADHMVNHDIGRLPVVRREQPGQVSGILTRSDILSVYRHQIEESRRERPNIRLVGSRFLKDGREMTSS